MKITVLGTGMVGTTLAARLVELGHEVTMGTRDAKETRSRMEPNQMTGIIPKEWFDQNPDVKLVDFKSSVEDAAFIMNATNGQGSLPALKAVGAQNLEGKTLIDISNPLDFSQGFPPSLFISNTDSLAEQIQNTLPETKVIKSLNTMNAFFMLNPDILPGDHVAFLSGNDGDAKSSFKSFLKSAGWKSHNIMDLGDITTARGTEQLLPIWVRLYGALGTGEFNFNIVRK